MCLHSGTRQSPPKSFPFCSQPVRPKLSRIRLIASSVSRTNSPFGTELRRNGRSQHLPVFMSVQVFHSHCVGFVFSFGLEMSGYHISPIRPCSPPTRYPRFSCICLQYPYRVELLLLSLLQMVWFYYKWNSTSSSSNSVSWSSLYPSTVEPGT